MGIILTCTVIRMLLSSKLVQMTSQQILVSHHRMSDSVVGNNSKRTIIANGDSEKRGRSKDSDSLRKNPLNVIKLLIHYDLLYDITYTNIVHFHPNLRSLTKLHFKYKYIFKIEFLLGDLVNDDYKK